MDRRSFLRILGLGAAVAAADPEFLLWRPGAKTIFLPPVQPTLTVASFGFQTGDIFTMDGIFSVNPLTGAHTGMLQRFVITDITNATSIQLAPPLEALAYERRLTGASPIPPSLLPRKGSRGYQPQNTWRPYSPSH